MKTRPCKLGCGYPALARRQFCVWHWLLRQSSDVQADHSRARLADATGEHVARVPRDAWPQGERWCAGCQTFVPLFYTSGTRCKACTSMASHARRVADNYGIDADRYAEILAAQGGVCAICWNTPRTIRLAVDHDHDTGAVRGLLCKRCNHDLLGGGHDSIEVLWRALAYLLDPPAQRGREGQRAEEAQIAALRAHLAWLREIRSPKTREAQSAPF